MIFDAGLRASCAALSLDMDDARAYAAVPDAQAQGYWSSMIASLGAGAKDCVAGVDQHNSRLIKKATDEIAAGSASFRKLFDRLTALAPR
jgi:hypothetical protein